MAFNKDSDLYVKDVRLPRHVIPKTYVLELQPNLIEGDFTTSGSLRLEFEVEADDGWEEQVNIFIKAKHILCSSKNSSSCPQGSWPVYQSLLP